MSSPSEAPAGLVPPPPPGALPASGQPGQVPAPPAAALPVGAPPPTGPPGADPWAQEGPRHLHPAAIGVWSLAGIGPLILLLVVGTLNLVIAAFIIVFSLVGSTVRWWRFRWQVTDDALVIEQGLLQRQRRVIPLERIQSVEAVRQLRHRLFGVTGLRVEAVGGSETQGQLDALRPSEAAQLRADLLRRRRGGPARPSESAAEAAAPGEGADALALVPAGQLVVAGLTGGRVGVVAALLGFASQFFAEQTTAVVEYVSDFVGAQGLQGLLVAVALFAAAVFLLSVGATVLTFWRFTLTRDERNLYTSRGLLDQRTGTIPLHRVQTVRVEENLVRRWLGRAAVRVEVAGQAGDAAEATSMALPIGSRRMAFDLATRIIDRPELADVALESMPRGARDRRLVRALLATVALTAAAVWFADAVGLAAALLVVPLSALALDAYRALGHAEPGGVVVARSGVFVRATTFTPERCLQGVALTSTPLQRRRGLASLELHIARSPSAGGGDPELVDLDEDLARAELRRLAALAAHAGRQRRDVEGRLVRPEQPRDAEAIAALHRASGGERAADRVAALRAGHGFDPALSLVCERGGRLLGHALVSEVGLEGHDGGVHALAALAVDPEQEGEGVEGRLVKAALAAAAQRGAARVVAVTEGEDLGRFGFEPAAEHGLAPDDARIDEARWLVRRLPADDGRTGRVRLAGLLDGAATGGGAGPGSS